MPSMLVSDMQAAVGSGASFVIRPPVGEEWLITEIGSSRPFLNAIPNFEVWLRDGIHADALMVNRPSIDQGRRYRMFMFYITNSCYLRVTNIDLNAANIAWSGERVRAGLTISQIRTIGAGATILINPPSGHNWEIYSFGASVWTGAGDRNPNVNIGITDGVLTASRMCISSASKSQDHILGWIIDQNIGICVQDASGGGLDFGFVGRRVPINAICDVQDIAGGGTMDIQPPLGEDWTVTEIAAEQWGGAGVAARPDVNVSMRVGANYANFLEAGSISQSPVWVREFLFRINNTHYLRITNVNVANNEVGYLGYLKRQYSL